MEKGKKSEQDWLCENTERRREKWSEAERWSVRESRLRGIERKMERKVEYGRCLLIFLVIQLNGEGQREEESWNLGAGVSEAQVQASLIILL